MERQDASGEVAKLRLGEQADRTAHPWSAARASTPSTFPSCGHRPATSRSTTAMATPAPRPAPSRFWTASRDLALPRLSDRSTRREVRLRRGQLAADLRRVAHRRAVGHVSQITPPAHDDPRGHAVVLQRLSADAHPMGVLSSVVGACRPSTKTRSIRAIRSKSRSPSTG